MEDRLPRTLAAILYADVASYSRLTGEDEDGTHRTLRAYLNLISSTVNAHEGRVVHYAGDAVLADFGTVVDALSCAVAIQRDLAERNADVSAGRKVQFRIGVNSGDVIIDQEEIYGDGVNVAARLEALAEPGGICISDAVRTAVGKKLDLTYQDMGEQHVKNIDEPVRAYRVVMSSDSSNTVTREERSTPSRSRPSVAVLPFSAIGGGQETEEFADALTDDIVSTLSRIGQCQVSDRSTTFSYKGQSPKPAQVAHDLGVGHVLQGSVRRSGNRMRITAELFSTDTQRHAWSERFDRTLDDEFQLQDEIATCLAGSARYSALWTGWSGLAEARPIRCLAAKCSGSGARDCG